MEQSEDFYMLPGGVDITIEVADPYQHREAVFALMKAVWPSIILEDADTCRPPDEKTHAVLAYRNQAAFLSWQLHGATNENGDDMLHILFGAGEIICVVHDERSETKSIADRIRVLVTAA